MSKIINKGTGAGGKNTTKNGSKFEANTCMEKSLLKIGYEKEQLEKGRYYLYKNYSNKNIVHLSQTSFQLYIKKFYNIDMPIKPDEAYILKYKDQTFIKILEKKCQHVSGSVDIKLLAGNNFKRIYEKILGDKFIVEYAFSLNNFLKERITKSYFKYFIEIAKEDDINIFYGEEADYRKKLYRWVKNF